MFWTSSECLMYVQYTSCVYWGNIYCTICKNHIHLSRREQHVQEHFRTSQKVCEICSKDFRGNYEIGKHKNYKHVGASICCPCKNCNKKYKSKNGLKNHLCAKHKEKNTRKPLVCKNCSKSFFDKKTFNNHMRLYHEKLRLTCRRCGAEFASASSHYHHEKVCLKKQDKHDERATFLCTDISCEKKCRTIKGCQELHFYAWTYLVEKNVEQSKVARNIFLSHHSNRNYICDSCSKSFKYR